MLAGYRSDEYLEHVRRSSQSQILVRNGVFGGYGRALTQNDGRTPRKLVDEDRTAVGRVRMQVGRGSRCHPIRIAYIFRVFESRSSFWRHRPTAGCARARATSSRTTPPPARVRPPSGPRGAARARARGRARGRTRARRERRGGALGSGGSDLDDDIVDLDAAAAEPLPPPLSPPPTRARRASSSGSNSGRGAASPAPPPAVPPQPPPPSPRVLLQPELQVSYLAVRKSALNNCE